MIKVIFGVLLFTFIAIYAVWRRRVKPVVKAEERLIELRNKKEALRVRSTTVQELEEVAELERQIAKEESRILNNKTAE